MAKKRIPLDQLPAKTKGSKKQGQKKDEWPKTRADGTIELQDGTILRKHGHIYHNITDPDTLIMQGEADRAREKQEKSTDVDKPAEKKKSKFFGAAPDDPLFG